MPLIPVMVIVALLGSALVGGVFFAFSNFVMKALARLPSSQGIAAMQSINIVVINRWFMGLFFGTALLSLGLFIAYLPIWHELHSLFFLTAGLFYCGGTFLVTLLGNVPWNDRLAGILTSEPSSEVLWREYVVRWTTLNHIRTVSAIAATLFYILGLMQNGVFRVL